MKMREQLRLMTICVIALCGACDSPPTCADAVKKVRELADEGASSEMESELIAKCKDYKWSAEVRRCFADAKDADQLAECTVKLTNELYNLPK